MVKRVLPLIVGFFIVCQQAPSQVITAEQLRQTGALDVASALALYRPDLFSTVDGTVLIHGLPALTLLDGRRFPISTELGRMGLAGLNVFPVAFLTAVELQPVNASPVYGSDSPSLVNLSVNRYDTGGEVGVFYGSGKHGRQDKEAHVLGGVGNDKFQFNFGASYQESRGRFLSHDLSTPPY